MRQHGFEPAARGAVSVVLGTVLLAGHLGCTHNYYYGAGNPCGPVAVAPAIVENGVVCEVPGQVVPGQVVTGSAVAQGSSVVTSPILGGTRPPRVVVSEPRSRPRLGWRSADPDGGLATTRIEGAVDDPTVTR